MNQPAAARLRDEGGAIARTLRTPTAAACAGILFAALTLTATLLLRFAIPAGAVEAGQFAVDEHTASLIKWAAMIAPFAGICFLWFVGVVRYRLGDREDRLFSTVLLGSGFVLVALMFTSMSLLAALVIAVDAGLAPTGDTVMMVGALWDVLLVDYATRMAGVFTLAVTTLGLRTGVLPVWLAVVGYLAAAAMLLAPFGVHYVENLFPLWVAAMSVYALVKIRSTPAWRQTDVGVAS